MTNRIGRPYDTKSPYYWKAVSAGVCVHCKKPRGSDGTSRYCKVCAAKLAEKRKLYTRKWKKEGKCLKCGMIRGEGGNKSYCKRCAEYMNRRSRLSRRKAVADGRCAYCYKPRGDGLVTVCQPCRVRTNNANRIKRRKRSDAGLCRECQKPRLKTSLVCETCYFKTIAHFALGSRNFWPVIKKLWIKQGGRCAYTGQKLILGKTSSVDHKRPRLRYPKLKTSPRNLQWVHRLVNTLKSDMTETEFLKTIKAVAVYKRLGRKKPNNKKAGEILDRRLLIGDQLRHRHRHRKLV